MTASSELAMCSFESTTLLANRYRVVSNYVAAAKLIAIR